ncbi:MAG: Asp23/Gls24 family envelope stress response protein [Firmicutes bacterium]|nr:Asp23/Gls24 family envelope stress response protein [Bacillota bacterium]
MALHTSNLYGKIMVTDEAITTVAGFSAIECYGVYGLTSGGTTSKAKNFAKKHSFFGSVRVETVASKIYLELDVILRYGVNVEAVAESIKSTVKYNVENFTGIIVETVNINVLGIRV